VAAVIAFRIRPPTDTSGATPATRPITLRATRFRWVHAWLKKLLIIGIPAVQRAELYLHAHESLEDAQADRESCEDDGAYRTTDILEIPSRLADQPGFYEHTESLLRLMPMMGFPSAS
jgi:hypothetical protein